MFNEVAFLYDEEAYYTSEGDFNPAEEYPEYPFDFKKSPNSKINWSYQLFRKMLHDLGLDKDKYGTREWNPLGKWIVPGQTVVIKPNWVNDNNRKCKDKEQAMDCLVTHPSFIRAACDYVLIALRGKGKVLVCDAPIQDCQIEKLWKTTGYDRLISFYKRNSPLVTFCDLRSFQMISNRFSVKIGEKKTGGVGINVKMDDNTAFTGQKGNEYYSAICYTIEETMQMHKDGEHYYSIAKPILEADVIINFPKPKSHRYAGFTAALKNIVGMVCEKSTLPHRRIGSLEEGGDSYPQKSILKKSIDLVLMQQARNEEKGKKIRSTIDRFLYGGLYYLCRLFEKDISLKGCWHGNDTIWRTILDLNYLVRYTDKKGKIQNNQQRMILNFADMITIGEKNGPLSPEPHHIGGLMFSENAAMMDLVICKLMGFDSNKIPLCKNIISGKSWIRYEEPVIYYLNEEREITLNTFSFPIKWKIEPHDTWKGHIENIQ